MSVAPRYRLPLAAACAAFLAHLAFNPGYGFFRDELYFIICGRHPQWGYVDQPPLVPLLAAGTQIFGHSLVALRAVPALCSAASIFITCLFVQEFEGGAFAQVLAAVTAFLAPVLMNFGMKVSPDTIGLWAWPLAALCALKIVKGADPRLWLAAGAAIGIAAEAKYSVIYFAVALIAGLLIAPERRVLFTRWFAAGAALAIAIALPSFLWQAVHGFPMIELLRNGQMGKNVVLSPPQYLAAELLITNPLLSLVWLGGLILLLVRPITRFLGYTYVILIAAMIASHAKHYYPADVYPYVFAAGGVAVEIVTSRVRLLRPVALVIACAAGLLLVPYALPLLPEQTFIAYNAALAPVLHTDAARTEHNTIGSLPQDWADMHGWPQLAQIVGRVYQALPPAERAQAAIVASNYGEAAAIDFFGTPYALPPVLSGHNQYFLWGTHGFSGNVIIDVHGDCGAKDRLFRSSVRAATFSAPYVMPYEDGIPIMVCRGLSVPLAKLWPAIKDYE